MHHPWIASALAATLLAAYAAAQTITSIGVAPGGTYSAAYGVSADGAVVAATSTVNGPRDTNGYRWTREQGLVQVTPSGRNLSAWAVSGDGSCTIGFWDPHVPYGGYVHHIVHGLQSLDVPPYFNTAALAVSSDGATVVGEAEFEDLWPNRWRAFRWHRESGTCEELGLLPGHAESLARGISADGTIICGDSRPERFNGLYSHAVRWTPAGGLEDLGMLPGDHSSFAWAVSGDGSTIIGSSMGPGPELLEQPVRWLGAGIARMNRPYGTITAAGLAASFDACTVVGVGGYVDAERITLRAALWSPATGAVDLNTYLPRTGVDLTGWVLETARGVSTDGRTIVGHGTLYGATRGWVVQIPRLCGTSDFNNDGDSGTDADIEAFFACLAGHCCPTCPEAGADFNADGDHGTDADIESFFRVLAGGTC
jgi:uncharacterized membrane protein